MRNLDKALVLMSALAAGCAESDGKDKKLPNISDASRQEVSKVMDSNDQNETGVTTNNFAAMEMVEKLDLDANSQVLEFESIESFNAFLSATGLILGEDCSADSDPDPRQGLRRLAEGGGRCASSSVITVSIYPSGMVRLKEFHAAEAQAEWLTSLKRSCPANQ